MGAIKCDNDRLIGIIRKRLEGATLQEIADVYGCSRENIRQQLGRAARMFRENRKYDEVIFPNIRRYMLKNKVSKYRLSEIAGVKYNSLCGWIQGKYGIPLNGARAIAAAIGMTVDEAFDMQEGDTCGQDGA